jgi:DNA repair protein RadC
MPPKQPHFHGHRQRLRERFLRADFVGFQDYEVVELLLTLAIPRSDVKEPAKALIERFGNLRGRTRNSNRARYGHAYCRRLRGTFG